jgi:hypothetical protein
MKFELSTEQLNNLKQFLNRSTIQGAEIGAFVELVNILNKPEDVKPVEEVKKEEK